MPPADKAVRAVERIGLGPVLALVLLGLVVANERAQAEDRRAERAAFVASLKENTAALGGLSTQVSGAMQRGRELCLREQLDAARREVRP